MVKLLVKNVPREGEFFIQVLSSKFYDLAKSLEVYMAALMRVSPFIIQSLSTTRFYNKPVERKLDPPRSKI